MQLWTQDGIDWIKLDIEAFPLSAGDGLLTYLSKLGIMSHEAPAHSEPQRLLVFSPEECGKLECMSRAIYNKETAYLALLAFTGCVRDMIDEGDEETQVTRECAPSVLYIEDGQPVLSRTSEGSPLSLAIDIDGRLTEQFHSAH